MFVERSWKVVHKICHELFRECSESGRQSDLQRSKVIWMQENGRNRRVERSQLQTKLERFEVKYSK
jgi:hypothetical protein